VSKPTPCSICGETAWYMASGKGFCRLHRAEAVEATKEDSRRSRSMNSVRTYEKMRHTRLEMGR
jgi:hypothetical protein